MQTERQKAKREILTLLLKNSRVQKFAEDYRRLEPAADGKIRTVMSPLAWTGRMVHRGTFLENSTNLANISSKYGRLNEIYNLRDVLIAEPRQVLGYVDLSQAEARVAAWMSRDELAIQQYNRGIDRYRFFAGHFYERNESKITHAQRTVGKMGVLLFQYAGSWSKFQGQVNKEVELTGATIDAKGAKKADQLYHRLHPGYRVWHRRVLERVQKTGHIRNCFGRRIDFFNRTDSPGAIDKLKRDAVASLPQSTIADLLNSKLVEIHRALDPKTLRVLLQVHDAILFSVDRDSWRSVCRLVLDALTCELEIEGEVCGIPAEISVGERWGSLKDVTKDLCTD